MSWNSGIFLFTYALLWVIVVMLLTAVLALLRRAGLEQMSTPGARQRQGPELGAKSRSSALTTIRDKTVIISDDDAGYQLLLFSSVTCSSCKAAMFILAEWVKSRRETAVIVVCSGHTEDVWKRAQEVPSLDIVADPDWALATAWKIHSVPFGVLLVGGTVAAKGHVSDKISLDSLFSDAARRLRPNDVEAEDYPKDNQDTVEVRHVVGRA